MAGEHGWPGDGPRDVDSIILSGLTFYGFHGVHPEERALGQRFVVDVALQLDLRPAGIADDLTLTTSYSDVYRAVREVVEGPPRNLLEAVAEGIAESCLRVSGGHSVRVRVSKPWAPVRGMVSGLAAVEVYRRRGD